jgi:UDP-N-acetylmuramoyl-L-alanyl-D-glutamate--2,6-diaminopimelate ligase
MKDYFRAKKRLFDDFDLKDGGVINYDDPWARKLMHYPHTHTFGTHSDADFCLKKITPTTQGTSLTLRIHAKMYDISWPVLGTFQALNLLAALAMLSRRFCVEDLMRHVPHLQSPPGRMELYLYEHKKIVIDFAHTPDALEKALLEVKKIAATDADASVWVIFGCGGNRDKEKRALMGAVADRLADHIVLTNDNPRYEHPESIVYDIQKGIKKNTPHILLDRKKAISFVISHMGPKDCLLIAGKGHETTQIIQGTAYDLSDRQIVADWVQQKTE